MNQFSFFDDAGGPDSPRAETSELNGTREIETGRGSGRNGARAAMRKRFVLDTNVLLHNPASIARFGDNDVCIPVDVLSELDRFKSEPSDRGANARAVHRALTEAFGRAGASVTGGVGTAGGGTLRLALFDVPGTSARRPVWFRNFERLFPDLGRVDHRIIATALRLKGESSDPVILVTKDLNMQLKARAAGLECEDYLNDKVEAADVARFELREIEVAPHELQRFASSARLEVDDDRAEGLAINEYVLLVTPERKTMPARLAEPAVFRRLSAPKSLSIPGGSSIRPVNLGQQCLLDALLDPSISLVTCYGHAGTGKTLLAVAAGLHAVFSGAFRGVTVSRPVVSMGDTLGYLPGTLDEKMRPWLQPIYDALDFLMPGAGVGGGSGSSRNGSEKRSPAKLKVSDLLHRNGAGGAKPYEPLIEKGIVEIEALCYIRGRSIPHRFFILDEAQQLTPLEAKTVVTRMSERSKLVMVGDPAQIDNPYVDSRSNGLVYTRNRLRSQRVTAHVPLAKGERSPLADLGATLM